MVPLFWWSLIVFLVSLTVAIILVAIGGSEDNTKVLLGAWVLFAIAGVAGFLVILGIYMSIGRGLYRLGSKAIDAAAAKKETHTVVETVNVTRIE